MKNVLEWYSRNWKSIESCFHSNDALQTRHM